MPDEPDTFPPPPPTGATAASPRAVTDLRRDVAPGATRVRIARHENPYEHLEPDERLKVIIRVLCGLVAYDAADDSDDSDEIIDVSDTRLVDVSDRKLSAQMPVPGPTPDPTTV